MSSITYQEKLNADRTEKIRSMLKSLPASCSDFISSIAMTTSVLTRMAYTIDLQTFCDFATKEIPFFADKLPVNWTDEDLAHFTARDLTAYADYLTLYYKDADIGEMIEQQKVLRNREYGIMRKLSTLRSFFDFLFKAERISGNIAALVSLPKLHEKPILHLVGPEVEKLLSIAEDGTQLTEVQQRFHAHTQKRDFAILMLFLGTGIRVSECVGIDLNDLDFANNAVLVTRKGGNQVTGTETKPRINPDAVRLMKQRYGIDMDQTQYSKTVDRIPVPDVVISMGCDVGCPYIGRTFDDNWQLPDPTGEGDEAFEAVMEEIHRRILELN